MKEKNNNKKEFLEYLINLGKINLLKKIEISFNDESYSIEFPFKEATTLTDSSSSKIIQKTENTSLDVFFKAPLVGRFYLQPSPTTEAFVKKGSPVKKGDVLCIIEAMKVMNEIYATQDCIIDDILIENGQVVEFDQSIFKIRI